jgi:hypothetical protein
MPDVPDLPEMVVAAGAALERPQLSVFTRFGRWLRKVVITTVVLAGLLATGAYFARPYLPTWMVAPVEAWVRSLPLSWPFDKAAKPGD